MPYCAGCDRFYNPNTLDDGGDCPAGHHVADPSESSEVAELPVPWHFKVMLFLLIVYLGWRFIQLMGDLV